MTRRAGREPRIDPDPEGERRRAARARLGLDEEEPPATPGRRGLLVRLLARLAWAALGLALCSVLAVAVLRVVDPPLSALMLAEWLQAQRDGDPAYRLRFDWRPAARISPHLARAVIAAEDQKFYRHHGFDLDAIADALASRRAGGRLRGASTISQQVAKNLFLWRGRDWLRKGLEAWFTVWIEALWPKARILEMYLNLAQFGRGVYGAEAASRRYFGIGARALDAGQSALLATALPAPVRRQLDRPSAAMRSRQQWILRQMRQLNSSE